MVSKIEDQEPDSPDHAIKCAIGYDVLRNVEGGNLVLTDRFRATVKKTAVSRSIDWDNPDVGFKDVILIALLDYIGEIEEKELNKVYQIVSSYFRRVEPDLFLL